MKTIKLLSYLFISVIFLNSCSEEQETIQNEQNKSLLKSSYFFKYDNTTKKVVIYDNVKINLNANKDSELHFTEFKFESNNLIPISLSNEEIKQYVDDNLEHLNGKIILTIDGNTVYESDVLNGIEYNIMFSDNSLNKAYPCTFDGLSKCTQDRIQAMPTLDKLFCIADGAGCVGFQFASCGWDNCGGPQL